MPIPLADSISAVLRTDRIAALAAALVIGTHHADVLQFVVRTVCGEPEHQPDGGGRVRHAPKSSRSNGHRKPCTVDHRLAKRDEADEALLAALKANPEGTIGDWVTVVGKSRSSIVSALHRLRDADLVESSGGKWRLAEPEAPREPAPRWVEPLGVSAGRTHAHA